MLKVSFGISVTAPNSPTREGIYTNNINSSVAMHSSKYQRVKSALSYLCCCDSRESIYLRPPFPFLLMRCTRRRGRIHGAALLKSNIWNWLYQCVWSARWLPRDHLNNALRAKLTQRDRVARRRRRVVDLRWTPKLNGEIKKERTLRCGGWARNIFHAR